jgi:tetratricopeptide (TPR) repeat protein
MCEYQCRLTKISAKDVPMGLGRFTKRSTGPVPDPARTAPTATPGGAQGPVRRALALEIKARNLATAGNHEEAIELFQQAAAILRPQLRVDATATQVLVATLFGLARSLSETGRAREAITAGQEATPLAREWAAGSGVRPAKVLLQLNLLVLAKNIDTVGTPEEKLAFSLEAERLLREYGPEGYEKDLLLRTLLVLAAVNLHKLGRAEEAEPILHQAIEYAREFRSRLNAPPPAAVPGVRGSFAAGFNDLGSVLCRFGRREEACEWQELSIDLRRAIAAKTPGRDERELAAALTRYGWNLGELDRPDEMVAAGLEAVQILRRSKVGAPHDDAVLRDAVNLAANGLNKVGRTAEALTYRRESIDLRRILAAQDPATHRQILAEHLASLAVLHGKLDQVEEAVEAGRQCRSLVQDPALVATASSCANISDNLHHLFHHLRRLDREREAIVWQELAIELQRTALAQEPERETSTLARRLNCHAWTLFELDMSQNALAPAQEAVALLRALGPADSDASQQRLSETLDTLANVLAALGRTEEAIPLARETATLMRAISQRHPGRYETNLKAREQLLAKLESGE